MASHIISSPSLSSPSSLDLDQGEVKLTGTKTKKEPIIETSWKVGLVFSVFILAGLLTVTILMSKGIIHAQLNGWVFKTLVGATTTFGTFQLITIVGFICYYFSKKKQQEVYEKTALQRDQMEEQEEITEIEIGQDTENQTKDGRSSTNNTQHSSQKKKQGGVDLFAEEDDHEEINTDNSHKGNDYQQQQPFIVTEPKDPKPETLSQSQKTNVFHQQQKKARKKKSKIKKPPQTSTHSSASPSRFNKITTNSGLILYGFDEPPITSYGCLQLPFLGKNESGMIPFAKDNNGVAMAIKINVSDFNVEYFIVFDNSKNRFEDGKCSIAMHPIVVPYLPETFTISVPITIQLTKPIGLKSPEDKNTGLSDIAKSVITIAPPNNNNDRNSFCLFSPTESVITLDTKEPISSFRLDASFTSNFPVKGSFPKQNVRIHAIVINNDTSSETLLLREAMKKPTANEFMRTLEESEMFKKHLGSE